MPNAQLQKSYISFSKKKKIYLQLQALHALAQPIQPEMSYAQTVYIEKTQSNQATPINKPVNKTSKLDNSYLPNIFEKINFPHKHLVCSTSEESIDITD